MKLSDILPLTLCLGIAFSMTICAYIVVSSDPPLERQKYVNEFDCGDYKKYLWKPKDTIGIAYTAEKRQVHSIPQCIQTTIGVVDKIGDFPEDFTDDKQGDNQ